MFSRSESRVAGRPTDAGAEAGVADERLAETRPFPERAHRSLHPCDKLRRAPRRIPVRSPPSLPICKQAFGPSADQRSMRPTILG
jgi:hypothetical protein